MDTIKLTDDSTHDERIKIFDQWLTDRIATLQHTHHPKVVEEMMKMQINFQYLFNQLGEDNVEGQKAP